MTSGQPEAVLYLRVSTTRQATKAGASEGYSIPAQREACTRKATELGATVVDEYVDAGASARSADRPALQALLERLSSSRDIAYVIVHKVDRLARDRADDVAIGLAIHKAGAVLVSASEQIDDTPAGTLLHGIMATIAEFYSKNLAHEVKKGLSEKVRRGGTPTQAPLGYLNVTERVDGKEIRAVALDPDRAEHIIWAFETYATGDWSITDLTAELGRRGMKSRSTAKYRGTPLTRSAVHRILSNPYYIGKILYNDVLYNGTQQPLVDAETWHQVQVILSARRMAGDRSWKHAHYLKGSLFCIECGSRLGFGYSTGKLGTAYPYYYCLGRNKQRTPCDLPYLRLEKVEAGVARHWRQQKFSHKLITAIRNAVHVELATHRQTDHHVLVQQKQRLKKLERSRQKLIDAYLDDAISKADLKLRQDALALEQREAERLIELAGANHELAEARLETALGLLEHCEQLYVRSPDEVKQQLNQVFFTALFIDQDGNVAAAELSEPFAFLTELGERLITLREEDEDNPKGPEPGDDRRDEDPEKTDEAGLSRDQSQGRRGTGNGKPLAYRPASPKTGTTNPGISRSRGSDVDCLAEGVGFEPTGLAPGRFQGATVRPLRHPSGRRG